MDDLWEVVKASWLQLVTHKKGGTLHRKKKTLYGEGKWVVLCVHNGQIPFLEWYFSEKSAYEHRPSESIVLENSSFVSVAINDPSRRSFMIGFVDNLLDTIELSALTAEDCDEWIRLATSTLVRLKCMKEPTNLYTSISDIASMLLQTDGRSDHAGNNPAIDENCFIQVSQELASSTSPVLNRRCSQYSRFGLPSLTTQALKTPLLFRTYSTEEKKGNRIAKLRPPPPLPPRTVSCIQPEVTVADRESTSFQHCTIYDQPKNQTSPFFEDSAVKSPKETPANSSTSYSSLGAPTILDIEMSASVDSPDYPVRRGYSVPGDTLNIGVLHHSRLATASGSVSLKYDLPCGMLHKLFPVKSKASKKQHKQHSTSWLQSTGSHFPSHQNDNHGVTSTIENITVQTTTCKEYIVYVEFGGKLWIAGWTSLADKDLAGRLRVGDQLIRVGDVDVYSKQQIQSICNEIARLKPLMKLTIQKIPYGAVYTLQKTKQKFDAGFILDNHTIRLADVREGLPAWKAGIRASVSAVTRMGLSPTCITCIDKHSLNLFSEDDQIFKHIDIIPLSSCFSVVVHPYDFVKVLKKDLKKLKNFNEFIY